MVKTRRKRNNTQKKRRNKQQKRNNTRKKLIMKKQDAINFIITCTIENFEYKDLDTFISETLQEEYSKFTDEELENTNPDDMVKELLIRNKKEIQKKYIPLFMKKKKWLCLVLDFKVVKMENLISYQK